jgi:drug/metabolite transporter (DMT)-like permease
MNVPAALLVHGAPLFVVTLWGMNFVVTKFGLEGLEPLPFAVGRTVIAGVVFALVLALGAAGRALRGLSFREHLACAALGALGTAAFPYLYTLGLSYTGAANGALVVAATPITVALIGAAAGVDRLTRAGWFGAGLSIGGLALVVLQDLGPANLTGDLIMVATMVSWSLYTVGMKPLMRRGESLVLTAYSSLWGVALLTLVGFPALARVEWSAVPAGSLAAVVYAGGVATGLGYILWNRTVRIAGPARTSIYVNLIPVVAALGAYALLGEPLVWIQGVGAAMILSGVGLAQRGGSSHEVAAAAPADR